MSETQAWLAAAATVGVLLGYELVLALAHRRDPQRLARSAHAALREEWFATLSAQKGSELLAVQTLRNSLMSATLTASTAALALMGSVTLAAPSLHASLGVAPAGGPAFSARLALELALMALLFASLLCSAMAVRYYNHASFIGSMPVESEARQRWSSAGTVYVRRAGVLYSWGLRNLILVAPIIAAIVHPAAGPVAAVIAVAVLFGFDRVGAA
ncbi:DUF599 domain-containing protein [Rivibacter subsaxonicus]|uniref:Uncharacterized protein DUF599 n=1 Tax=Rivibacter subsaxonicus TaxID=457575 RepID=A0A4V2FRV8_9BURK|nr:DUF599 domain-containing protein [Rivibacter subsaxonicus]RZT91889.1 uncharacterized protein DUF599 [Rivibacter subsaxonicus]